MTQVSTAPETPLAAAAPALPSAESIAPTIEAVLFSSDRPLTAGRLAEVLGLTPPEESEAAVEAVAGDGAPAASTTASDPGASGDSGAAPVTEPKPARRKKPKASGPSAGGVIKEAVGLLNAAYEQTGRAFRIEAVAGGYRVMMLPQFAPAIASLQGARARTSLSHAALEALAIISYKQPITRARLEAIRGVACGEILRSLTERRLVTIVGRAEEVGRPLLYGTTKRFLELFGLSNLKDLPSVEELKPKS